MKLNTIGDITGFGDTLEALVTQMPNADLWCLGDIIDRGPNSKKALDFLIDNGHKSIMGNHDHMMFFEKIKNNPDVNPKLYPNECWIWNGGGETLTSLGINHHSEFDVNKLSKYFDFIESMPLKKEIDNIILTHAPINNKKEKKAFDLKEINKDPYLLDRSILWNRLPPRKMEGKFQVYGHNSPKGILWHTDKYPQGIYMADPLEVPENPWGVCIDTWRTGYLTGLHIETEKEGIHIQVFQHKVIDPGDWMPDLKKKSKGTYRL